MGDLFFNVLYRPLFNLLIFFYNLIPDIGIAIIIITIAVKVIMWPLSRKSLRSQRALQTLQPKIDAIKEKYKGDKEKIGVATMELYKTEKINPLASCLPLLIQLPIIFAMFRVFRNGLTTTDFSILYGFVSNPETINPKMFGIIDLAHPQIFLGVLAGAAQFWHTRILMSKKKKDNQDHGGEKKDAGMTEIMSKQMMYVMPVLTVVISAKLPGGLALYWLTTTFFSVVEQYFVNKNMREEVQVSQNLDSFSEKKVIDIPSSSENNHSVEK